MTTLVACLAAVCGCQGPARTGKAVLPASKLADVPIKTTVPNAPTIGLRYASLEEIGRFAVTHPHYEGVGQMAISPSKRLIAVKEPGASDSIEIHRVHSGRLAVNFKSRLFGLGDFDWHPRNDLLGFAGGRANDARTATDFDGMYCVLNGQSGRVVKKIPVPSRVSDPVLWTPDGRYLISTKGDLVNLESREARYIGFQVDRSGNNLGWAVRPGLRFSISPGWVLAVEYSRVYTEPPSVELYKARPGDPETFAKTKSLTAQSGSFRTQPVFLSDGRLAFVKVFLDADGSRKRVEIWTSKDDGTDERPWVKLPVLGEGADGKFSVAPVAWSPDGRVVAYARGRTVIMNAVIAARKDGSISRAIS